MYNVKHKLTSYLFLWGWQNTLRNQGGEVTCKKICTDQGKVDFEVFHSSLKIGHGIGAQVREK